MCVCVNGKGHWCVFSGHNFLENKERHSRINVCRVPHFWWKIIGVWLWLLEELKEKLWRKILRFAMTSTDRNTWFCKRSKFTTSEIEKGLSERASCRVGQSYKQGSEETGFVMANRETLQAPDCVSWQENSRQLLCCSRCSRQWNTPVSVGSGGSPELEKSWVDVCRHELAMPRTPVSQFHGSGKVLPGWGSGECQTFPPGPCVNVGSVYRKYLLKLCHPTMLIAWRLLPYRDYT